MRITNFLLALCLGALGTLTVSDTPTSEACMGSTTSVCTVSQTSCLKTMVFSKSVPLSIIKPAATSISFDVQSSLFINCPTQTNCGTACAGGGAVPVGASIGISLFPFGGPQTPPPSGSGSISTNAGTMTMPACMGGVFNSYVVPINVPASTATGCYSVVGRAVVAFSDGTTLTQNGDTIVCLVEPAPGNPTVPRLNLELMTTSFPRVSPGDQHATTYRITNNDPTFPVTLTGFANSKQNAIKPLGGNEFQGVYAISNLFGDDYPIAFDPGSCIPLPSHPFTQPEISMPVPILGPGMMTTITVRIRSYGQCASGSCSESTLRVEGTFGDGSPAKACSGMALFADTSVPTTGCATGVNDCNMNGIPDAVDIFNNPSLDLNFNALPDQCEVPILQLSAPQLSKRTFIPTELIQLSLVSNGPAPVSNVWVNGLPMSSPNGINWVGQIPAASTIGPHTLYVMGKDVNGKLASNIATYRVMGNVAGDFDGDNKADLAVFRPSNNTWYILGSSMGFVAINHGLNTDVLTPGDYDGDRRTNIAVWRPSNATFYPDTSPSNGFGAFPWGQNGDRPVIGDYDGDGRTDFTIFRPSNGTQYTYDSLANLVRATQFGVSGDVSVPGDYDGDGRTDVCVWRPSSGVFFLIKSVNNTFFAIAWGQSSDRPIVGDFDGDGKNDQVVFRPSAGVWYINQSSNGSLLAINWGLASDTPVAADYDGDGKTDVAVFRPSTGVWYVNQSSNGALVATQWGLGSDTPIPSTFVP